MLRSLILSLLAFFPYVLMATSPVVEKTERGIELRNDHAVLILSEKAEVIACIDKETNSNIAVNGKRFAYASSNDGKIVEASELALENDNLAVTIGQNRVLLEVFAYDDYFTFEVVSSDLPGVDVLTFFDLKLSYDYNASDLFLAAGIAMNLHTHHVYYPSGESKEVIGQCTSHTGFNGAKLAVVACKKTLLWNIIRKIYRTLPENSVPVVLSSGGPFAPYSKANRYDCVLIGGTKLNPDEIDDWTRFYMNLGIKQFEFLDGPNTFIQGQFTFPRLGSAAAFKKRITEPLDSLGVVSTFHTYSYYISSASHDILSSPKWQQQLEFRGEHTLAKDMTVKDVVAVVLDDVSYIRNPGAFSSVYSSFILIDKEIIRYSIGSNGFVNCVRGQCGTTVAPHKKGTKIRVVGGYFSYFAPQIGSELFYEIARRTARAYNEGGFRGFYFDALDGLGKHLSPMNLGGDYQWYYGAAFINEVLKYCEKDPLVLECSHIYPSIWPARGRGECWEAPHRGYKRFIDVHTSRNKSLRDCQYITTLGWYIFCPVRKDQPGNYSTKYMFSDEVDYLGYKSIAYDQTMVYQGLRKNDVNEMPALKRNLENYAQYAKLRMVGYFSEKVKEVLKQGLYEYRLRNNGRVWGFDESVYCRIKIRDIRRDRLEGLNPFRKQKPFIRLENLYSSDESTIINLLHYDERTSLTDGVIEKRYPQPINIAENLGIKVSLHGGGKDSKDALCIRLRSAETPGYADYVVRLNFDGWREVLLPNLDNAENKGLYFKGMEDSPFSMHYYELDYSKIQSIQVFKSGECNGVRLKSIDAVPLVQNELTNPTVKIGSSSVTFIDTIRSGEYVEYHDGAKSAVVYDSIGNERIVKVNRKGVLYVPTGPFSAYVEGTTRLKEAPSGVTLTLGLFGKFIHN